MKRCGVEQDWCVCSLPPGHDGPHICTADGCGGSWEWDGPVFRVVRFPGDPLPAPDR